MTEFLLRLFVKNYKDTQDPAVRTAYGKFSGWLGIVMNALLFAGKFIIGTLSGSVSIIAEAVNNLSDAASSVVTLIGFRLAAKPADESHPYGHHRIEYICGLAVAALVLVIGVDLIESSVEKILHPEKVVFSPVVAIILIASIVIKLLMSAVNTDLGKRISSEALLAAAVDSRNDVISTCAVLVGVLIGHFTGLMLDGWIGLLVALFILWSGIGIARDTIDPLLGNAPDPALVREISQQITKHEGVLGIHDLIIHDYGPGRRFASVHVEMDAAQDVLDAHELIDNIEREFRTEHNLELVIHYDPIVTDDAELNAMRERVLNALHEIDDRLAMHDFRMVRGKNHTNLIFDLVVPLELQEKTKALRQQINEKLQFGDRKYFAVITFDSEAFNGQHTQE